MTKMTDANPDSVYHQPHFCVAFLFVLHIKTLLTDYRKEGTYHIIFPAL